MGDAVTTFSESGSDAPALDDIDNNNDDSELFVEAPSSPKGKERAVSSVRISILYRLVA